MNKDSWYWLKTECVHFDDHIHWIFNLWWKSGLKLTDSFKRFLLTPIYLAVWIIFTSVCACVLYRTGIKDVSTVKSVKWPWTWRTTKATTRSRTATRKCCSFTLCDASWTSDLRLSRFSCSRNVVWCVLAPFASQVWILFTVRGLPESRINDAAGSIKWWQTGKQCLFLSASVCKPSSKHEFRSWWNIFQALRLLL